MSTPPDTERPPVAVTTEGQPSTVEANGNASFAHCSAAGKPAKAIPRAAGPRMGIPTVFRASTGAVWRYSGKRGRVLAMLATMPAGLTQWDCLPWHTRLGGTIHALRCDGLAIDTEREGKYRHARYRLATTGSLIKQGKNRGREQ